MNTDTNFRTTKEVMQELGVTHQTYISFLINLGLLHPIRKAGRSHIFAADEAAKCKARIQAGVNAEVSK